MNPVDILRESHRARLRVRKRPIGNLLISPPARLTPELQALLLAHKPALLESLREAEQTTAAPIEVAMRGRDVRADDPEERELVRREVLAAPPRLRADLLAHLRQNYGRGRS